MNIYRIVQGRGYDGSPPSYVSADEHPARSAIYCQLLAEQLFGPTAYVSSLGIAYILVTYFDCDFADDTFEATVIDIRSLRNDYLGDGAPGGRHKYLELMTDRKYSRDGLEKALKPYIRKLRNS
ncbi:hypothetical protein YA0783_25035 [Pseudomonas corrugata]|uniref:hypothetical protein n=1 Tax=Pseudomonas corrugata TaxID=47879 RepID=UPI0018E5F1BC|nr:hypothetical protein [Pseudomonas corrugata]MBI6621556.1 hypothetical protein [Pseudomonas corrugata]MBI6694209.1 hypothetical protein [Pseudomonas corrugata]